MSSQRRVRRTPSDVDSKATNLNTLLHEMQRELVSVLRPNIRLHVAYPRGGAALVTGPASQLRDLILHLALDAQDAMPVGGTLTIRSGNVTLTDEYSRMHPEVRPGDYAILAVCDSGDVPSARQQRLTADALSKGRATGFAAGYEFIAQTGGHISISRSSHETTVKIYLIRTGEE